MKDSYKTCTEVSLGMINWVLRQERVGWYFWWGWENPRHKFREVHSQNIACMQTRCYLNKSDPEVLMESIINKQCEVPTWCIQVAAGASIYSGLVWILNDVSHAYSHICRFTSSDLSGNKLFSKESCNVFYKGKCRRFYTGKCWPFLQWKSLSKTGEFAYKVDRPILEIWLRHFAV